MELLADMTSFIENGIWSDITPDLNLLWPLSDLALEPLSSSTACVATDVIVPDMPNSQSENINSGKLISATSTMFANQCSATQTEFRDLCLSYNQTDDQSLAVIKSSQRRDVATQTDDQSSVVTESSKRDVISTQTKLIKNRKDKKKASIA